MQHRKKKVGRNSPRAVVVEALDARAMLSSTPVASKTEILANISATRGLHALESYLLSHSDSVIGLYVDLYSSRQLFRTKANSTLQLKLQTGVNPLKAVKVLKKVPRINWASPNYIYGGTGGEFTPNDTNYASQLTQLNLMQVPQAWDTTTGSSSVVVAVADDGMDYTHEDLQNVIYTNAGEIAGNGIDDDNNGFVDDVHGWDFLKNDNDVFPAMNTDFNFRDSHGTAVAGIIGAVSNNAKGVAGVAGGGVKILPVRFYGFDGLATSSSLAQTIAYIANRGVKLMNISFSIDPFMSDPAFVTAYTQFYNQGGLWLNSAGNSNAANPPRQNIQQALFVTNTDDTDVRYSTSNYGYGMDLAAPGVEVSTIDTGNAYTNATGTSFSTANVTGIAALIWSAHPTWTRDQVAARLVGTTDNIDAKNPGFIGQLGSGRVNAYKAVSGTLAAPQIRGSTVLPAENGTFAGSLTSFTLDLKNVFNPLSVIASNFELRGAGTDGQFNTSDDVVASLTLSEAYGIGTNRLTFNVSTNLPEGKYRFTAKSTLADPFGMALDGNGDGTAGDAWVRNFNLVGAAPTAPSSLAVVASLYSGSEAVVSWNDNSNNETSFVIERSTSSTFATLDATRTAAANTGYYYDWGLGLAGTTYYYRIRAIGANGASDNSNIATFKTEGGQPGVPAAPSNLVVAAGSTATEAALSWKDNSNNETAFLIEQSLTSDFATVSKTITAGFNSTVYWDWGLTAGTTYYYRIVAVNGTDRSTPSNTASLGGSGNVTPSAPTSLAATAGATSTTAVLNWHDTSSNETGFVLERSTSSTFATIQSTINLAANVTTYSDTGLTAAATYYYRVKAVNGAQASAVSNTATYIVPDTAPTSPTSLTAAAGATSTSINLGWVDNSSTETGFVLERSLSSTFATIQATVSLAANTTAYSDSALSAGTQYYYRVSAVKGTLASTPSNIATFTTPGAATAPAAPSGLTVTISGSTGAHVIWTDNSNNETGFEIQRATDTGFSANLGTTTVASNIAVLDVTGLTAGTTYYFRVRAINATGPSAYTAGVPLAIPGSTNAIGNAGFETPTTTTYVYNPTGGMWVFNTSSGIQHNGSAWNASNAPEGVQTGFIQGSSGSLGSIGQTINFSAGQYNISFKAARRSGQIQPLKFMIDGVQVGTTITPTSNSFATYTTVDFTVTAGSHTIAFVATDSSGDKSTFIDGVALNSVAATAPSAPKSLTATGVEGTPTSVTLAWTDNSFTETGFSIERSTSSSFATIQATLTVAANVTTYTDSGLSTGTTYYYRVKAVNGALKSTASNTDNYAVPAVPSAPSALAAAVGSASTSAVLTWTDNSSNEKGFVIQRSLSSTFATIASTANVGANVKTYTDTGLTLGTTYYYRVLASNGGALSTPSSTVAFTPIAAPTLTVTSAGVGGGTKLTLAWTNVTGETSYEIQRSTSSSFSSVTTLTSAANSTGLVNTGLNTFTTYYYRIRAVNGTNTSVWSATGSAAVYF